jgi:Tfp pilus assembly PilM family ATPase
MSSINDILERLRSLEPEAALGLKPPYPPVALQITPGEAALVRVRRKSRGRPLLEALLARPIPEPCIPASIFQPVTGPAEDLTSRLRELFELSGTRPGRVSLILPDNLAKISLLNLPERPASRKHLEALVHAKMRRAVPFKLDEASLTYQLLPGGGREAAVLVVLVRRSLVERFEHALESLGATAGLVDISTPNLMNLYRGALNGASRNGGDAGLLNCARNYFSLVLVRDNRLIFFRCKTFVVDETLHEGPNGVLVREIASSLSYYREKLDGEAVGKIYVRSVSAPFDEIAGKLVGLGVGDVEPVDPQRGLELGEGVSLDAETAQRLAPALGAALGRGR